MGMPMHDELYKEVTRVSYQETANEFALNVADLAPVESIESFIKLLPAKAKIIDIGCGSGRDAKIFTDAGIDVVGIDFCSNFIQIAKNHAPLANFQLMDIETINLPSAVFDGAWAACSLGHIPKHKILDVLKKIHMLLKREGHLYLSLKKGEGEILEKDARYSGDHQKFWSFYEEDELRNYLENSGFKILDFKLIEKKFDYHTHSSFRVFCQKFA